MIEQYLWASGVGYVALDYALTFFSILAVFLTVGVLRAPEVVESNLAQVSRRIMLGGLLIYSSRFIYVLIKYGDLPVPPITGLGTLFILIAICLRCVCALFPDANEIDLIETKKILRDCYTQAERMEEFVHHRERNDERKEDKE